MKKRELDINKIPQHVAIIMDGNGRWAKRFGMKRIFGHRSAIKAVRESIECAAEIGVSYLTLYAFSSENWNRPKEEVEGLMDLLVSSLEKELPEMNKNNIRLETIGDTQKLTPDVQKRLRAAIKSTEKNTRTMVILALSYGSRDEIVETTRKCAQAVADGKMSIEDITEKTFSENLYTGQLHVPDPDLIIRTSGEERISNFLLWQSAYSEFYFTKILWPDFRKKDLIEAVYDYQHRERRFGKTTEQVECNDNK